MTALAKIGGIAQASDEQARGVEEVNTAVGQVDTVTQSISANAEQSAAASEELNSQAAQVQALAEQLRTLVDGRASEAGQQPTVSRRTEPPRPATTAPFTAASSCPRAQHTSGDEGQFL